MGSPTRAFPAAGALGAEDPVQLLHRHLLNGIVLVHDHAVTGLPAGHVVRPGGHLDLDRRAVGVALEELLLRESDLAADADVAHPEDKRRDRGQRRLHVKVDLDVRVVFLESRFPVTAQEAVGDVIAAPRADAAVNLLLRLVLRQAAQVPFRGVGDLLAALGHHLRARRLHVEPFRGRLALLGRGLRSGAREQGDACRGDGKLLDHGLRSLS